MVGVSENDAEEPAHDDNIDDADENIHENGTSELPKITKIPRIRISDRPRQNVDKTAESTGKTKDGDNQIWKNKEVINPITTPASLGSAKKSSAESVKKSSAESVKKSSAESVKKSSAESFTSGFQIRKRKKPPDNQGLKEALETFIKMKEKTNAQQRELEEKMTKHQMECEMKLRQLNREREDKRRREERQFQLQMMQMQMQMFGGIVNQGFSGGYMNNHSVYNDTQAGPSSTPNVMPMQYQSTCTRAQYSTTPPYVQQGVQPTPNPYIQTNPTTDNDEQHNELKNFTVL